MFVDSLDALHTNSGEVNLCLLGSSELEVSYVVPITSVGFSESIIITVLFFVYLIIGRKNTVTVRYWNSWSMSGLTIVGGGWST